MKNVSFLRDYFEDINIEFKNKFENGLGKWIFFVKDKILLSFRNKLIFSFWNLRIFVFSNIDIYINEFIM